MILINLDFNKMFSNSNHLDLFVDPHHASIPFVCWFGSYFHYQTWSRVQISASQPPEPVAIFLHNGEKIRESIPARYFSQCHRFDSYTPMVSLFHFPFPIRKRSALRFSIWFDGSGEYERPLFRGTISRSEIPVGLAFIIVEMERVAREGLRKDCGVIMKYRLVPLRIRLH